jgi:hypothetical protein
MESGRRSVSEDIANSEEQRLRPRGSGPPPIPQLVQEKGSRFGGSHSQQGAAAPENELATKEY